jgi:hypothetical protein
LTELRALTRKREQRLKIKIKKSRLNKQRKLRKLSKLRKLKKLNKLIKKLKKKKKKVLKRKRFNFYSKQKNFILIFTLTKLMLMLKIRRKL